MPFPLSEINFGGTFAFIVTLNNDLRIIRVVPIYGRLFSVDELGYYLLDEEFRYITTNGRSEIYFFSQKGCNPISLSGLIDVQKYLDHQKKRRLEIKDLALFVDKIRAVESGKGLIQLLRDEISRQKDPSTNEPLTEEQQSMILASYIQDQNFDHTIERIAEAKKALDTKGKLDDHTIAWLNGYFKEDIVSRYYLTMRQLTDEKYKIKPSKPVSGAASFMSKAAGKKHIGIICINNARIDFDPFVKLVMNDIKGHYELITKKYGTFSHKDAKSRYKFGRQNVFAVMVRSIPKSKADKEKPIATAKPKALALGPKIEDLIQPSAMAPAQQAQVPVIEVKRSRGRPKGSKNKVTIQAEGTTHQGPTMDREVVLAH
jgi:hypothetical protein